MPVRHGRTSSHDDDDHSAAADLHRRLPLAGHHHPAPSGALVACSHDHAALRSTPALWAALPLVGHQVSEADEDGPRVVLELRDCSCGSTLARDVTSEVPGPL